MALFVFVTQTMFSMLVFRCRGPGDTTSKVSCCVKPSYCFKNSKCPCTPLKISLPKNKTMVNLKSASFVVIMLLHKGLTHIQSQIKPWLLFGESFSLSTLNIRYLKTFTRVLFTWVTFTVDKVIMLEQYLYFWILGTALLIIFCISKLFVKYMSENSVRTSWSPRRCPQRELWFTVQLDSGLIGSAPANITTLCSLSHPQNQFWPRGKQTLVEDELFKYLTLSVFHLRTG